jgi:chitobiase/beta-hexosaminidase-like protein
LTEVQSIANIARPANSFNARVGGIFMRRRLFAQPSVYRSIFQCAFHAIPKLSHRARKPGPVDVICLTVLALGVACLTEVYDALARPPQPQAAASCGPAFTAINAGGAGTGALQGTTATGINAEGDVVGIYITAPNIAHGYVRTAATGAISEFDAPGAGMTLNQGTFATGIDTAGDVVGIYADSGNAYHGFVRSASNGVITAFDVPGAPTTTGHRGTSPISINATGATTGLYTDANAVRHGFIRSSTGTFTTFDVTVAGAGTTQGTIPVAINAGGDVTGFYLDSNGLSHAFIRTASTGTITAPIDALGAGTVATHGGFSFAGTIAIGIDTAGDIAGIYADANSLLHGYVRAANGTITEFNVTGAAAAGLFPGTVPTSMNAAGDIAGLYTDASGVNHAFVRSFATSTITAPLDAPGASTSGMVSGTAPFGINSSDELAGIYTDSSGVFHAFVATTAATAATPTFSPVQGTYGTAQSVAISDTTAGATIYYTTDGTTPTTASTLYSVPIAVSSTETIEAIAVASGCSTSSVATALYTIAPPAATPTFSPVAGTYTSVQTVTFSDATAGATIYYTTNGTTPTTSSTVYTGPIAVNSTETIEAIAAAAGFSNSSVATAAYTINLPTPDFLVSVNPTTLTIVAGQSGQATFTVTPENGFNSKVSFACSGLPSGAACIFNPTSVTPNGAAATSTLTVTTTAASAALRPLRPSSQRLAYAFVFPALALLFGLGARRKQMLSGLRLLAFLALLVAASGLASCNSSTTSGGNTGTPVGTSMASVSASAAAGAAISHAASLTITITH